MVAGPRQITVEMVRTVDSVCILMISCMFMVVWPGMRLYVEGGAHRIARGHTARERWSHYSNLSLSDSTAMLLTTILGTTMLNDKSVKAEWKVHGIF